jgi:uncharacterized protein
MEAVDVRGRFVWHQLLTRDIPGAKKFYSRLAGWKAQPWPLDPSYTVFQAAGVPAAGMMEMTAEVPAEAPPHWLQYIGTRDVDGTADAAVRAGGSILKPPSDMKGAGRYAVLQDPQGAIFAIIDPENARPEPEGIPPLGTFSWHELATTDHEAAFAFYRGLFGWDAIARMDMGPIGVYLIFGQGNVQKGGIYTKPADAPGPPNWLPYAHVSKADDSATLAESLGARVVQAPMEVPGGSRIAVLLDPTGAAFAVHSMPPGAMAAGTSGTEAQPKSQPKTQPKTQAKTKSKAKRKTKGKASGARKPRAAARANAKPKSKSKSKSKARSKSRSKSRSGFRSKASARRGTAATRKASRPAKKSARRKK